MVGAEKSFARMGKQGMRHSHDIEKEKEEVASLGCKMGNSDRLTELSNKVKEDGCDKICRYDF